MFLNHGTIKASVTYRNLYDIPHDIGTAVNVRPFVYGNGEEHIRNRVASRNPSTGENKVFGEVLNQCPRRRCCSRNPSSYNQTTKEIMPEIYDEFISTAEKLEQHCVRYADIEFTIEEESYMS